MLTPKKLLEKLTDKNQPEPEKAKRGHIHQWSLIAKTYAPPSLGPVGDMSDEAKKEATLGVTTILWQCQCGETKKETMLGSDNDTMEELMQKAEILGPQYIERNGKTFVFMRWVPPSEQQGYTPIK